MRTDHDTEAETRKVIAALAAESFANHALVSEGDRRWYCAKVGTGVYSFRVISAPGHIIVFGDIGDAILSMHERDPIPWLRGSINSPAYLFGKVQNREEVFYAGDAQAWLKEQIAEGGESAERAAAYLTDLGWPDEGLERESWYEAWSHAGESSSDLPDFDGPSSQMYWILEALRCFVRLLDVPKTTTVPEERASP